MKIAPYGERLIVRQMADTETKSGLIIRKEDAQLRTFVGVVLHVGPDAEHVEIGDTILFAKYSGSRLQVDGKYLTNEYEDCLVMNESDILGVLEPVEEPANA